VAEIGARFDHRNVNEIPPFDQLNTTAELNAKYFHDEMAARLAASEGGRVTVSRVDVWENEGSLASYREE
jgi:6-pyruvoyltetrahydropterin/6-carboxytetrahydropterin synthase